MLFVEEFLGFEFEMVVERVFGLAERRECGVFEGVGEVLEGVFEEGVLGLEGVDLELVVLCGLVYDLVL